MSEVKNPNHLFKRTEVIGRGKFGVVYKGINRQTNKIVAIKVLNLDTQEDEVKEVQQEIQFLTELKNVPNVTHYYGSYLDVTKLWIIMDYCAGGSVRTLLKPGIFEERYLGVIVRELLIALQAVHKLGVIHRDLKAANVLISKDGRVQLCDFGVAAQLTSNALKRTTMAGTPYWMAPEVIREGDTYNVKADIWSLGITIFEIATGNPPYCEKDAMWAMQLITKSKPPRLEGRQYSPLLKEFIALCLDENPVERPFAEDLLKSKFVKFHKNTPTNILKEVISRYLLWREKKSSRDSIAFMSIDDELNNIGNEKHLQVKWDFDSLSSTEYIIENDIDIDEIDQANDENSYQLNKDEESYLTQPTLQLNDNSTQPTTTRNNTLNANNQMSTITNSKLKTDGPKSLLQLFQDSEPSSPEDHANPFEIIKLTGTQSRVDSPVIEIEIPDMDKLTVTESRPGMHTTLSNLPQSTMRSKPPALLHTQSASANLETRNKDGNEFLSGGYTSRRPLGNPVNANNHPHHHHQQNSITISSNNLSSSNITPNTSQQNLTNAASLSTLRRTPSPKRVLSSENSSPSKSMKALQSNPNLPLLQPINFKLGGSNTNQDKPNTLVQTNSNTLNGATSIKSRRTRPGLHIQMPTPSNFNSLSPLIDNNGVVNRDRGDRDISPSPSNENINQFGINAAHAAQLPLTMTPLTEKTLNNALNTHGNPPTLNNATSGLSSTTTNITDPSSFSNDNDSNSSSDEAIEQDPNQLTQQQRYMAQRKLSSATSMSASNIHNLQQSHFMPPQRNHSLSTSSVTSNNSGSESGITMGSNVMMGNERFLNPHYNTMRGNNSYNHSMGSSPGYTSNIKKNEFPQIPVLDTRFFLDSTPKDQLTLELENMIGLFNHGLGMIEDTINALNEL